MMNKLVLYRDTQQGKLFGVCAGWAAFLQQDVSVIRILTVTFALFPPTLFFTVIGYLVMAIVLEDKPTAVKTDKVNNATLHPAVLLDDIETTLNTLDAKVSDLENYVTSESFEFQCKLWNLKR